MSTCPTRSEDHLPPKHHPQAALVRPKDHVPTEELAGDVYQIPCAACSATMVVETFGNCSRILASKVR